MRYKIVAAMLAITALASCSNTRSQKESSTSGAEAGWVDMLATKEKWHVYNKPGVFGSAWSLKNGVLHLSNEKKNNGRIVDGGNLVYDEEFSDFHLKLEWMIAPNGNSGIMFLVKEDPQYGQPYLTGPEMQVLDNDGHPDSKINKHRAGDLYDLVACKKETAKKAGEWNFSEIILKDGHLRFFLNGEEVVTTNLWDDNWKKMVDGSKFKTWPGFAAYKSGKIVLQDHDDAVSFRNVMIRKL